MFEALRVARASGAPVVVCVSVLASWVGVMSECYQNKKSRSLLLVHRSWRLEKNSSGQSEHLLREMMTSSPAFFRESDLHVR